MLYFHLFDFRFYFGYTVNTKKIKLSVPKLLLYDPYLAQTKKSDSRLFKALY
jgi:hypothetical protein